MPIVIVKAQPYTGKPLVKPDRAKYLPDERFHSTRGTHNHRMAITELNNHGSLSLSADNETSKAKIIFVASLFVMSLVTFICQTVFTSQAYLIGFKEPVVLLFVTHGSWWLLWPAQAVFMSIGRTFGKWRRSKNEVQYERLDSTTLLREHEAGHEEASPDASTESFAQISRSPPAARRPSTATERPSSATDRPSTATDRPSTATERPLTARDTRPSTARDSRPVNTWKYFKKCVVKQIHNVYHTSILVYEAHVNEDRSTRNLQLLIDKNPHISSSSSITSCVRSFVATPAFKYIAKKTAIISIVLNVAGFTWYGAMAMTYASDVTAIYNCSAFTAYAFAIPLLNETFSWLKASSVVIAVSGVFIVAYSGAGSSESEAQYPYRFWGNVIISVGAVLYGFYEVLYKKYTCVPEHLAKVITPRRQSTFSNFIMALLGMFTLILLASGILLAELLQIHHFNFFDYGKHTVRIWAYIGGSIVSNLLFSASFLSLMALTSPVLSSVSSLLTIFLIGIVEWVLFGISLSFMQLVGDALVIVGFVILTTASWKEISEGKEHDEIDAASFYSFAPSVNTLHSSV